MKRILVWDLPLRLFHWALVLLVAGATTTSLIGGNWMNWHGRLGIAIACLLGFRIVWGIAGSTTARFTQFIRGPSAIAAYLKGQWHGIGHNPLGALSVVGLLAVLAVQTATGLFSNDDIAFNGPLYTLVGKETSDWIAGLHKKNAWLLGLLVALHLAAIAFYTRVSKESLVPPMLSGCREAPDNTEPTRGGGPVAVLVAIAFGLAVGWAASGGLLPPAPQAPPAAATPNW